MNIFSGVIERTNLWDFTSINCLIYTMLHRVEIPILQFGVSIARKSGKNLSFPKNEKNNFLGLSDERTSRMKNLRFL